MLPTHALFALFAACAAAIPVEELAQPQASGQNGKIHMFPHVHPQVDRSDLQHLAASRNATMHYDSDANPAVDSTIATLSAPGAKYPIVLLENSQFINRTECTNDQAHIFFTNRTAFDAAVADWQKHPEFIIIAYDPKCGTGSSQGKRDFALVNKVTPDRDAMIVDADISFVSYVDAIGNNTIVHADFGKYTAPTAKRYSISKSLSIKWDEYPTNSLSDNQWGSGYQLYHGSTLDVICVGCGTKGDLEFTGSVDFSFFGGFDSAKMTLKGDMSGQLAIGLDAHGVSGSIPIASHQLAQIAIGGVEIPDIITLGPQIDISVGASLNLKATGTLLLGAELSWSGIDVELGLSGDDTRKGNGLSPTVTPKDAISGTLTATLDLHLPVSVGIGINILDGTWNKSLAVVDTPGFQLSASKSTDAGSCSGVELAADVYNNVGVDILELTNFALASWTTSFWSTCLFGAAGSPTPTPSRSPTRSPPGGTYTTTRTVRKTSASPTGTPAATPTYTATPRSSTTPKPPATTPKPTYTTKTPTSPKTSPTTSTKSTKTIKSTKTVKSYSTKTPTTTPTTPTKSSSSSSTSSTTSKHTTTTEHTSTKTTKTTKTTKSTSTPTSTPKARRRVVRHVQVGQH